MVQVVVAFNRSVVARMQASDCVAQDNYPPDKREDEYMFFSPYFLRVEVLAVGSDTWSANYRQF